MRSSHIVVFLCLAFAAATPSTARAQCVHPFGDVDGSSQANVIDVQCTIVAALWKITATKESTPPACLDSEPERGDLTCDGQLDVADVLLAVSYALELPLHELIDVNQDQCHDSCVNVPDYYPFTVSLKDAAQTFTHMGERLLDAPAGKHGVVNVHEGHFRLGENDAIRFWGINVLASVSFPPAGVAVRLADRLAKLGFNLVRFHWLEYFDGAADSPMGSHLGIWAPGYADLDQDGFGDLDDEQLQKLLYLIAQLKARGIYTNMNLLNGWEMNRHTDGPFKDIKWPARSRYVISWHPEAREQLLDYAKKLLTTPSAHLEGHALIDDDALALVEIINENNLTGGWMDGSLSWDEDHRAKCKLIGGECKPQNPFYMHQSLLHPLYFHTGEPGEEGLSWQDYLLEKYKTQAALEAAWGELPDGVSIEADWSQSDDAVVDLLSLDQPEALGIDPDNLLNGPSQRLIDTWTFLHRVEKSFYEDVVSQLKQMGVRCPITGSQFISNGAPSLWARSATDYSNTHGYWNHPHRVGPSNVQGACKTPGKHDNACFAIPQTNLLDPQYIASLSVDALADAAPIPRYARNKIAGKPLTISEWNTSYPSHTQYQLMPMLASYASFQDWDGVDYFCFSQRIEDLMSDVPLQHPHRMHKNTFAQVMSPAAALMFRHHHIASPSDDAVIVAVHDSTNEDTLIADAANALLTALGDPDGPNMDHYNYGGATVNGIEIPGWIPYYTRVERSFEPKASAPVPVPGPSEAHTYPSVTGELLIDSSEAGKEYFRTDTPKSQVVLGALSKRGPVTLSVMAVDSNTDAAFVLVSMDDQPLAQSQSALLVVTSDQYTHNSMILPVDKYGDLLEDSDQETGLLMAALAGEGPMMVSYVDARVHISSPTLAHGAVYALDPTGKRMDWVDVPTEVDEDTLILDITNLPSPWFELSGP